MNNVYPYFQTFREGNCDYLNHPYTSEHIDNLEGCQSLCQIKSRKGKCNFFSYNPENKSCEYYVDTVSTRGCDRVYGPPKPPIQTCIDDKKVPSHFGE